MSSKKEDNQIVTDSNKNDPKKDGKADKIAKKGVKSEEEELVINIVLTLTIV
jgi:hypothetical protein